MEQSFRHGISGTCFLTRPDHPCSGLCMPEAAPALPTQTLEQCLALKISSTFHSFYLLFLLPNLYRGSGGAMQYTGIRTHDSRSTIGLSESQTGSRTYYINNKMAVNLRYQKATRNNIPTTRDYYVINIGTSPRTDVGMLPHLAYCNRLRGLWEFSTVGMSPPTTMSPFASIDAQLE